MASLDVQSIFASTACVPDEQPVESRISSYQCHGLYSIELGAGVSVNENSLSQIANMEGQFLIHNYFPPPREAFVLNLASGDDDIRQQSIDLISNATKLSARIGAAFNSIHAGFVTDPTSFNSTSFVFPEPDSPDSMQSAMSRFISALQIVLENAAKYNIKILIENNVCTKGLQRKLLLITAEEFVDLFSRVHSPNLGVILDTGHLNVTAHTLGIDRTAFVDKIALYIGAIHIHDNNGIADTHQPIQPGSWVIDVLRRPEFASIPLIVEAKFDNVTELRRHVDWLKDEIKKK